ncbi:hypothetical protein CDN97_23820 [Pantoea sp. AMG 501]|nr:hypothetical protein CDN97_23820 [Pantoea sp. AMG 501]
MKVHPDGKAFYIQTQVSLPMCIILPCPCVSFCLRIMIILVAVLNFYPFIHRGFAAQEAVLVALCG